MPEPWQGTWDHWEGFKVRACGEHRSVGPVRAWCFDCNQWCYPAVPCPGCEINPGTGLAPDVGSGSAP